jgi:hypothetical protein
MNLAQTLQLDLDSHERTFLLFFGVVRTSATWGHDLGEDLRVALHVVERVHLTSNSLRSLPEETISAQAGPLFRGLLAEELL